MLVALLKFSCRLLYRYHALSGVERLESLDRLVIRAWCGVELS